jgi:Na+-translocating ferredoxin:NAD+ oxidoreductase RnfA subunit
VALGSSVLGAPLFLSDEKNPSSVRRFGRYLTQVVGVSAIVAALLAVWLLLTDGLRVFTSIEWAGILLIALVVNGVEMQHRWRKTRRTQA